MPQSPRDIHSKYSTEKKQREYELIEEFLKICPDFSGYEFMQYSENPDMVYQKGDSQVGFDSIIVSEDQATVDCYFDAQMCTVNIPTRLTQAEKNDKIAVFFENKLFKHWRRYALPTVLVFSLVNTKQTELVDMVDVASRFKLPAFELFNILDYYLCDGNKFVKISETSPT